VRLFHGIYAVYRFALLTISPHFFFFPDVRSIPVFRAPSSTSALSVGAAVPPTSVPTDGNTAAEDVYVDEISPKKPLEVLIAGAGVGGLALAKVLSKNPLMKVTVLEQTSEFKRFGGPIQLASNAMEILKQMDDDVYSQIEEKFTITGDKMNGIKDGIRTEWYAKFDLASPAEARNMPYTGVIERPDLQEIYLNSLPKGTIRNGDGIVSYEKVENGQKGVQVTLASGETVKGDVLIGADGIWSAVRATMRGAPKKGDGSGASYSGYTVFAGELNYDSPDNGEVGYKVYIGPGQVNFSYGSICFVIMPCMYRLLTDIAHPDLLLST
jgi:zeaxanthin epoxidase